VNRLVREKLVHGWTFLGVPGFDGAAAAIDQFAKIGIADVTDFKHIERPRDLPLGAPQDLCELLDVPKGLIVNPATRDDGVAQIQQRTAALLGKVVAAQARIPELIFWNHPVLSDPEQKDWKERLGSLRTFLDRFSRLTRRASSRISRMTQPRSWVKSPHSFCPAKSTSWRRCCSSPTR
jgi:hypothetical protein